MNLQWNMSGPVTAPNDADWHDAWLAMQVKIDRAFVDRVERRTAERAEIIAELRAAQVRPVANLFREGNGDAPLRASLALRGGPILPASVRFSVRLRKAADAAQGDGVRVFRWFGHESTSGWLIPSK